MDGTGKIKRGLFITFGVAVLLAIILGLGLGLGLQNNNIQNNNIDVYLSSSVLKSSQNMMPYRNISTNTDTNVINTQICADFSDENMIEYSIPSNENIILEIMKIFNIPNICRINYNINNDTIVSLSEDFLNKLNQDCNYEIIQDMSINNKQTYIQCVLNGNKLTNDNLLYIAQFIKNINNNSNIITYFVFAKIPNPPNTDISNLYVLYVYIMDYTKFKKSNKIITNTVDFQTIISGSKESLEYINNMCN